MIALAKKIVTLYIDDISLRLVVTRGDKIKEWAYLPLEQGLIVNNVITNESELATRIKQLFKIQNIRRRKIVVGLSGRHCLSRPITLPQLPKEMLDEAVRREARRVLPLSLEQLYLSWQTIPAPEGQSRVFLVALPCVTVDALVESLRQAGLEASFMGIKPLLLARTVKEDTAIIIDVQSTEFDVIIIVNGVPQTIRTVAFPEGELSSENKMEIISNELDRAINFYNTYNPDDSLSTEVPIFTSGELSDGINLHQALSDSTEHPVLPMQSPFACPEGFNLDLYRANMGLALHQLKEGIEAGPSLVTLNSLPLHYQTKSVSLSNILVLPGAVVAICLLIFLIMMNQIAAKDISSTHAKVDATKQALQQRLSQTQGLSGEIKELESRIAEVEKSSSAYQAALDSMKTQNFRINGDLSVLEQSLPNTINLSRISHTGSALEVTGKARSEKDVLEYFMNLESSNLFGEIVITKMIRVKDGGMDFTLSINPQKLDSRASNIEIVLRYLPIDVSLTSFRQVDGSMTIDGRAPNEDSIILFLKKLEKSDAFSEITLSSKTSTEDGGINFTFTVKGRE